MQALVLRRSSISALIAALFLSFPVQASAADCKWYDVGCHAGNVADFVGEHKAPPSNGRSSGNDAVTPDAAGTIPGSDASGNGIDSGRGKRSSGERVPSGGGSKEPGVPGRKPKPGGGGAPGAAPCLPSPPCIRMMRRGGGGGEPRASGSAPAQPFAALTPNAEGGFFKAPVGRTDNPGLGDKLAGMGGVDGVAAVRIPQVSDECPEPAFKSASDCQPGTRPGWIPPDSGFSCPKGWTQGPSRCWGGGDKAAACTADIRCQPPGYDPFSGRVVSEERKPEKPKPPPNAKEGFEKEKLPKKVPLVHDKEFPDKGRPTKPDHKTPQVE